MIIFLFMQARTWRARGDRGVVALTSQDRNLALLTPHLRFCPHSLHMGLDAVGVKSMQR